jgi:hypothetical protein
VPPTTPIAVLRKERRDGARGTSGTVRLLHEMRGESAKVKQGPEMGGGGWENKRERKCCERQAITYLVVRWPLLVPLPSTCAGNFNLRS